MAAPGDQNWDANFALPAGLDGWVGAMVFDRGSLYVGGAFSHAGAVEARGIARWDGTNWFALGSGVSGLVHALAFIGTNLYVAGEFDSAGGIAATNIAMWDGANWHDLQGGMDPEDVSYERPGIWALAVQGDSLYAGGHFVSMGGVSATNVARWDGTGWHNLAEGVGLPDWDNPGWDYGRVYAMTFVGQDLYVGGGFTRAGNGSATNIAKWDGTNWTNLGDGVAADGSVLALQSYQGSLCVGGAFTSAGGLSMTNLALWDGSAWQELGGGLSEIVYRLLSIGNDLYAGGNFWSAGGVSSRGIARWDGIRWNGLASGVNGNASSICVIGANIIVGGWFGAASGTPAAFVAQFNGSTWAPLGLGSASNALVGAIFDAAIDNGQVYVASSIASAGTNDASWVARWDGRSWSNLGANQLRGSARAVAAGGGKVYVWGDVTAPALGITNLACWNGSNWMSLGVQSFLYVDQLLIAKDRLFVAGWFDSIGGVAATNLAMWDGTNWSAVGGWVGSGNIFSMVTDGQSVYVAGMFNSAGSVPAQNVARWDGTNWSALGGGPVSGDQSSFEVRSLALYRGQLFAFARFSKPSPQPDWNAVMRWDGTNWSDIPNPFGPGDAYKIAAGRDYLYAYGNLAGTWPGENVLKWAGGDWLPMGGGLSHSYGSFPAFVLATGDDMTCMAGSFEFAGNKPSYHFAIWHEPPPPSITSLQKFPDGAFGFQILGSEGQNVRVQSSSNLTDWVSLDVQPLGAAPVPFLDRSAAAAACRFYKLLQVP